MIDIYR